jgi:hypothetical protein
MFYRLKIRLMYFVLLRYNNALQTTPHGRFSFFHSFVGLPGRAWFGASELGSLGCYRSSSFGQPFDDLIFSFPWNKPSGFFL